jgi:hypothetical protein
MRGFSAIDFRKSCATTGNIAQGRYGRGVSAKNAVDASPLLPARISSDFRASWNSLSIEIFYAGRQILRRHYQQWLAIAKFPSVAQN